MAGKTEKVDLLEYHTKLAKVRGFWEEDYKGVLLTMYMSMYVKQIVKKYEAVDFIVKNKEKVLVKWIPRFEPLTDEEYEEKYGSKN